MLSLAAALALTLVEPVCEPDLKICATVDVVQEVSPPATVAQDTSDQAKSGEEKKPPTPEHTGVHGLVSGVIEDFRHLPAVDNMYVALAGGGLALGAHQWDSTFNVHLRSHSTLVNDIFWPAKYYGDTPEQMALSVATWAYGRVFDEPKVSHLGMDLLRAQIVTETLVQAIKWPTHRLRPDGSNYQSFPSGHAAQTFAAATVLERHLGWKNASLAYAIATYVAMSRLHDNVHYLSDVVFGAAVGTIAGRTVTRHGREFWAFVPVSVPGGGVALMATRSNF